MSCTTTNCVQNSPEGFLFLLFTPLCLMATLHSYTSNNVRKFVFLSVNVSYCRNVWSFNIQFINAKKFIILFCYFFPKWFVYKVVRPFLPFSQFQSNRKRPDVRLLSPCMTVCTVSGTTRRRIITCIYWNDRSLARFLLLLLVVVLYVLFYRAFYFSPPTYYPHRFLDLYTPILLNAKEMRKVT